MNDLQALLTDIIIVCLREPRLKDEKHLHAIKMVLVSLCHDAIKKLLTNC